MPTPQKRRRGPRLRHADSPNDWERVGATVRAFRTIGDITQDELATAVGYRYASSIGQIEIGAKPLPDDKLIEVAKYLGIPPLAIRRLANEAAE